ncbi:ricin-type beta-trefoil lectin domain protein [Lentzea nigeriaca]|uniref:ricin-type beta-trefoil lectin domain protein n=1 Tax=Lentzea nigeriaca TaxID=1128665 RepID=UPI00195A933E|nr:ricin-type beta-trefoil lectin domain protein [Lentzea nigeriaca]MBM7857159.1 alpha-galactosidase [Lentzea nigeriaca]
MTRTLRTMLSAVLIAAITPVVLSLAPPAQALDNGLGRTPQLGWNDWNSFGCDVTDSLVRQTADAMVGSGMAAAGYTYVNIDDCWSEMSRDGSGNLVPSRTKFPNGMKAVADYVHGKGLKLGIYSSAGTTTCAGFPASLGNEQRDADLWASWGIDYLKYDNCGDHKGISGQDRYIAMRDALARTGRQIFFAICNWGNDNVRQWGPATGNSWRTTGDIQANWNSVMTILDFQPDWAGVSRPGAWNDPDMLEVGNGLSDTESQAHFSLWALLNAPLIAGNDLRTMSAATKAILTNTEVIGVNQDWGGRQGNRIVDNGNTEVWTKPMSNGSVAVVLLNRNSSTTTVSTSASQIGLGSASSYSVRDLWAHTTGSTSGTISASVPPHGAAMYVVSGGGNPGGSTFALRGTASGRCLDITGGAQANGTLAEVWDCNGQVNQAFTSTTTGELRAYNNTKCLDVTGAATANGTAVEIWDCNGGANQRFTMNTDGTVRAVGAAKCLDATGTANGAKVVIWDCNGQTNQKWSRV